MAGELEPLAVRFTPRLPDAAALLGMPREIGAARPLSVLMAEQVQALRDWAGERTVPAH